MADVTGQELVRLAMDNLDCDGPTDLARRLRLSSYHAPRRIKNWLEGANNPDFESTMAMLEAIGVLDWSRLEERPADAAAGADDPTAAIGEAVARGDHLEALRAAVGVLADIQADAARSGMAILDQVSVLGDRLAALEQSVAERESPPKDRRVA